MAEFSALQEEVLRDFFAIHRLVHRDTRISLDLLKPKVQPANEGRIEPLEFFFWLKTCIRSVIGEIDAVGSAMRRSVVMAASKLTPSISNRELAKLNERRFDRERNEVTDESVRSLSTLESFKLGLRFFPKLFGSDWSPNLKSTGWQALTKLAAARHDFTHPDRLEKLMPQEAYVWIDPALTWYTMVMGRLLIECSHKTDPELLEKRHKMDPDSVKPPKVSAPVKVLDEGFYDEIEGSLGSLIGYSTAMFKHLSADTTRALGLLKDLPVYKGKTKAELERSDEYQFAVRNVLRTTFSDVEGTIGYIEFLLSRAARRGSLVIDDSELVGLAEGEVEERLVAALNLWSAKLGSDERVEQSGDGWEAFALARQWRNKITHPTQSMDFLLLPSVMERVLEGAWWYLFQARDVLNIDEDRFLRP
jgi:hypothetical protein